MIRQSFIGLLFLSVLLWGLPSCKTNEQATQLEKPVADTSQTSQSSTKEKLEKEVEFKASNRVNTLIEAKVLKILPPIKADGFKGTCSKVSCTAYLKVTKMKEIGRFFDYSFGEGDEIGVYFTWSTAATTEELFPNVDVKYPGIALGDVIDAAILIQSPYEGFPYTVDYYEILP
mgnify:CR=1 FL=1